MVKKSSLIPAMKRLAPLPACLLALASMALAAAPDVKPAEAAPYAGRWAIVFPEEIGRKTQEPIATCDEPAIIEVVDEDTIHVVTPGGGDWGNWDIKSYEGRNPWWQEDGDMSLVTAWVTDNAFLLAGKDESGTHSNWDNARKWSRCPA